MHIAAAHNPVNLTSIPAVPERNPLEAATPAGRRRWLICGLLFFATTVNYMDRQVIALLKPTLQVQFGWTENDYGTIIFAFTCAYAVGILFIGKLIDRLGTRKGFSAAVFAWSAAAMAHAAAGSMTQFALARVGLGLGEAGSFPAAVKAVAEWFPKRARALATGLFNSGSNIGALVTPLVVPWITYRFGWRMAFIAIGALGFVWILCWLLVYHRPEEDENVSAAELGKFFTDPIWWVYLFWMPDFLSKLGLSLTGMALPLFVIYSGACVGSIGGGWLSSSLLKRGWTLNASRKSALLVCAFAVTPIMMAAHTTNAWLAVCLVAIAAGAHQGWSANIYTLASDMFPRSAVGSVVGFGTMAGAIGGMCIAKAVGYILQHTGSYVPVFVMAGMAYLIAFGFVQALAPRLKPAQL
jgi:ACS family hexuronate transporter-like MFS transporter